MDIKKCDFCKKEIKDKPVVARFGYLSSAELCIKCGEPVLKFLRKNKIINKDNKEIKLN